MKWIIILGLVIFLVMLIAVRYHRQIQTGIYVYKMFRKMRQAGKSEAKSVEPKLSTNENQLIRCAKCGTWIPQQNALKLRSKTYYCSTNCMEQAVKV